MTIKDLEGEPFVLHRLCSTTEQKILRLFADHNTRCRIVAEVRSFENIKQLVEEDVGLAIVPERDGEAGDRGRHARARARWRS